MRLHKIGILLAIVLFSLSTFPTNSFGATSTASKIYVVRAGDNLSTISRKYGVPVNTLLKINNLKNDKLQIDQKLIISPKPVKTVKTITSANPVAAKKVQASITRKAQVSRGTTDRQITGELVSWSEANKLFPVGQTATIYDLDSGLSFHAKRNRGHNHADSDPLTAEDTAIFKQIYGGSWSWDRRAIVIEINGQFIAASMNGMPHGEKLVRNNNFSGHFCIHFLGSKTHGSGSLDKQHQAMVRKAARQN